MTGQTYRDGDTRNIGGIPYVRQGGSWLPQAAPAPTGPMQPVIPRQPPPVRPVEQALDEVRLAQARRDLDAENGVDTPGDVSLTGDAYLRSLPQSMQSQVRALSEGRLAMPTGRAASSPYWQRVMQATGHFDPSFDAVNYQIRVQTRRSFTSGRDRLNVTALNTALGHLETLSTAADALDNGSWPLVNSVRNFVRGQTGDPRLVSFNEARQAVVDEMERAFRGTSGTEGGIEHWRESINAANSPEQLHAAIRQAVTLLGSRLDSLGDAYNQGMGRSDDPMTLLNPHARQVLQTLGAGTPYGGGSDHTETPPVLGQPPAAPPAAGGMPPGTPPGAPPAGGAPRGERMDRTTVNMAPQNTDEMSLNTSAMQNVADPALAGINEHVNWMLRRHVPDAQIRSYIQERGVPISQIPGFNEVLAWRAAHPNYQGSYRVELDKHLVPQSVTRQLLTNVADTAPGAAMTAAGNMVTGGNIPAIVGATGGDEELARAGLNEVRNRHPVASVVGDVGGAALTYGAGSGAVRLGLNAAERAAPSVFARLPAWVRAGTTAGEAEAAAAPYSAEAASNAALAPTATFAPRAIAGDAALGAYESPDNRLQGAVVGALTGTVGRGAMNSAGRAVSPTGGDLAPAYEEGVQPTLGQRMGGIVNRTEQAFQSIPVLGQVQRGARTAAQDQWQLGGFNRALRSLPDEPQLPAGTTPGTAPHAFAQEAFDKAYDRVHQRVRVVVDPQLEQDLNEIRQNGEALLSDQSVSHLNRILDNSVMRRLSDPRAAEAGLTGEGLQQTLSEVRRTARSLRSNPNGDRELASTLDDVAAALHDNAARHSPPEAIQTLNNINRGYGMLVRIENAANRGGVGDPGEYTPRALMGAERQQGGLRGRHFLAGDGLMTDYAKAGLRLGSTVPDSGTFERGATVAGMAGLAHFANPYFAAPWVADTVATLPGVRQGVNWALRPNRQSIREITDELRAQIQGRANLPSELGIPGVVAAYDTRPGP